jgi:hypothetical protein
VLGVVNIKDTSDLVDLRAWPNVEVLLQALPDSESEGFSGYEI